MIPLPFLPFCGNYMLYTEISFRPAILIRLLVHFFSSVWYQALPHQQSNVSGVLPGCCLNHLDFYTAQIVAKELGDIQK